jgi:hypothetical protein
MRAPGAIVVLSEIEKRMNVAIRQPRQLRLWHKQKKRWKNEVNGILGQNSLQWFTAMNFSHKSYHFRLEFDITYLSSRGGSMRTRC